MTGISGNWDIGFFTSPIVCSRGGFILTMEIEEFIQNLKEYGDVKDHGVGKKEEWFVIRNEVFEHLCRKATPLDDIYDEMLGVD